MEVPDPAGAWRPTSDTQRSNAGETPSILGGTSENTNLRLSRPPGADMADWPRSGQPRAHGLAGGDFWRGAVNTSPKLLGSLGKAQCLAAGHTPEGPLLLIR